jgi:hypothetical protein
MSFKSAFPKFPEGTMLTLTSGGFDFKQAFLLEQLTRAVYASAYLSAMNDMGQAILKGQDIAQYMTERTIEIASIKNDPK